MTELGEKALRAEYEKASNTNATIQAAVYESLKKCIVQSQISGEIAENQIASLLNVSRTPVREAMHKLSENGLLEITHGRCAKVLEFSNKDISDMALILKELHNIATVLCIKNADDAAIDSISETMDLFCFYTERGDLTTAFKYLTQFHSKVAHASGNSWLARLIDQFLSYTEVHRECAFKKPGRAPCAQSEHMAILYAIRARDAEKASQILREHVDSAYG